MPSQTELARQRVTEKKAIETRREEEKKLAEEIDSAHTQSRAGKENLEEKDEAGQNVKYFITGRGWATIEFGVFYFPLIFVGLEQKTNGDACNCRNDNCKERQIRKKDNKKELSGR